VAVVPGLSAPAVINNDVRTMGDLDRDAIRACDDPDALLALRLELIAANTVPWRRTVALTIGAWGIVTGLLIINMVNAAAIIAALVVLVALFALALANQKRARARAIRIAGWAGTINFRLQQLATKS